MYAYYLVENNVTSAYMLCGLHGWFVAIGEARERAQKLKFNDNKMFHDQDLQSS